VKLQRISIQYLSASLHAPQELHKARINQRFFCSTPPSKQGQTIKTSLYFTRERSTIKLNPSHLSSLRSQCPILTGRDIHVNPMHFKERKRDFHEIVIVLVSHKEIASSHNRQNFFEESNITENAKK
jgi:hypothetical protein